MAGHEASRSAQRFETSNRAAWQAALTTPRPLLVHLNADTTWLVQLPYPDGTKDPVGRSRFNVLVDPWLQGPQSDVASWFSTQWHVVEPSVCTIAELNAVLGELEGDDADQSCGCFVDAVVISHEFTDHCHRATLEELPRNVPVVAGGDEAAKLIGSWGHFDQVVLAPSFSGQSSLWQDPSCSSHVLPSWLRIARVVTAGNALYYHSAIMLAFGAESRAEAILYSPHGIAAADLAPLPGHGLEVLALLHGLHDVRIWMAKQLNLGAINGLDAVRACGARYWVATHDEVKRGGGLISWLLQRTAYSVKDVTPVHGGEEDYAFLELGSGEAVVLV